MNASVAQYLVTANYHEHIEYAYSLIRERSKAGFYNLRLDQNIWCVDSDLNRKVRSILDSQGYKTYFSSGLKDGMPHTHIYW